jgi:hypothetical protein
MIEHDIETGVYGCPRDEPGGCPLTGQVVSGMKATRAWSAAAAWNVGRPAPIRPPPGGERETTEQQKLRGAEYRCGEGWRTGS